MVNAVNEDGILKDVHISGDFFFYPANELNSLEDALTDVVADEASLTEAIKKFYAENEIDSPGVQPADFAKVLSPAT